MVVEPQAVEAGFLGRDRAIADIAPVRIEWIEQHVDQHVRTLQRASSSESLPRASHQEAERSRFCPTPRSGIRGKPSAVLPRSPHASKEAIGTPDGGGKRWRGRRHRRDSMGRASCSRRRARADQPAVFDAGVDRVLRERDGARMTERSGFFAVVDSFPTRAAFVDTRGDSATYGDLAARMNECARGLATLGLVPGDTVAVVMSNRRELLETYGAAVQTGLTFVAVNWHLGEAEIAYILEDAAAKALIVDGQFADAARELRPTACHSPAGHGSHSTRATGSDRMRSCAPGRAPTSSGIGAPARSCSTRRAQPGGPRACASSSPRPPPTTSSCAPASACAVRCRWRSTVHGRPTPSP